MQSLEEIVQNIEEINVKLASGVMALPPIGATVHFPWDTVGSGKAMILEHRSFWRNEESLEFCQHVQFEDGDVIAIGKAEFLGYSVLYLPENAPPFEEWPVIG